MLGATMCGFITDEILFVNKSDSSLQIVKRHYDCGAGDTDFPKYEFYKIRIITNQILYSKKVDTAQIKQDVWIRKRK